MILRKGRESDLKNVLDIEVMAYKNPYWSQNMIFEVLANKTDKRLWIYEVDNDAIGFIIDMRNKNEISLLNIAIHKYLQGMGHGLKMLKKYIKSLPRKCSIYLEVNKNNIKGNSIVEIGCGAGRFLNIINRYNPSLLVGVDASDAVNSLSSHLNLKNENLLIIQADVFKLPFKKNIF